MSNWVWLGGFSWKQSIPRFIISPYLQTKADLYGKQSSAAGSVDNSGNRSLGKEVMYESLFYSMGVWNQRILFEVFLFCACVNCFSFCFKESCGKTFDLPFQQKYACVVLELERLNTELNEYLTGVQNFCQKVTMYF